MNPGNLQRFAAGAVSLSLLFAFAPSPAQAQSVDLQEIFRCADHETVDDAHCNEARNLVVNNCTTCHTFVPIVMQQFDEGGWRGLLDRHRSRVSQLSDEQVEVIRTYLTANFNDDFDPPELPAGLLATWTDY